MYHKEHEENEVGRGASGDFGKSKQVQHPIKSYKLSDMVSTLRYGEFKTHEIKLI